MSQRRCALSPGRGSRFHQVETLRDAVEHASLERTIMTDIEPCPLCRSPARQDYLPTHNGGCYLLVRCIGCDISLVGELIVLDTPQEDVDASERYLIELWKRLSIPYSA